MNRIGTREWIDRYGLTPSAMKLLEWAIALAALLRISALACGYVRSGVITLVALLPVLRSMVPAFSALLAVLVVLLPLRLWIMRRRGCPRLSLLRAVRSLLRASRGGFSGSVADQLWLIDNMDGHAFEYRCAALLKRIGFKGVKVTQGSGDQGVDILAVMDGVRYAIQCKNYAKNVGNKSVQEISAGAVFYGADAACVLTNSYFTDSAIELADANGVILWDRDSLEEMLRRAKRVWK